jgi:predicted nucleotidyltransferase
MPLFIAADRDATLERVLALLDADPRIEAAVITGSLGAGTADRWSDLDLVAVVADDADCERVTAEWVKRVYEELPVAHHYETAFGTTLVRGFLLTNALLVDLAFTPSADFRAWAPVRVDFDRGRAVTAAAEHPQSWAPTPDWRGEAGFGFHDVLHAWSAAHRDRRWESLFYLQRVRNRALALASERHGHDAEEFRHVDDLPAVERDPLLASLVSDLDRKSLFNALDVATRAFLVELRRGDPALADRLGEPLLTLMMSRGGDSPRST